MDSKLESLKKDLMQKLNTAEKGVVGQEVNNLLGQFYARSLAKSLLRILLELSVIWVFLAVLLSLIERVQPFEACVKHVFYGGYGVICLGHPVVFAFFVLAAVSLFLCSCLSTLLMRERRFQHSALLSVGVFLIILWYASKGSWGLWVSVGLLIVAFFTMFFGYRLAENMLYKRRKAQEFYQEKHGEKSDKE